MYGYQRDVTLLNITWIENLNNTYIADRVYETKSIARTQGFNPEQNVLNYAYVAVCRSRGTGIAVYKTFHS